MTLESLVARLRTIFDLPQATVVDVVNERLGRMIAESTALRAIVDLGPTVSGQSAGGRPAHADG
jgi:hypothetical protein